MDAVDGRELRHRRCVECLIVNATRSYDVIGGLFEPWKMKAEDVPTFFPPTHKILARAVFQSSEQSSRIIIRGYVGLAMIPVHSRDLYKYPSGLLVP